MFSRLTGHGRGAPNLVVAQRVIDKMVAAAQRFIEDETGEAMVGLLVPGGRTGVDTLYVLDTISPDETAVRQLHTFQQGDERQDELIWWLQENWRVYRERRRAAAGGEDGKPNKWDVPLRYLGDWHKQPGYMIQPSGGDLMTALNWIEDPENDMDFLLAPIVTVDHPPTTIAGEVTTNFITVPQGDGLSTRIDFWYINHRVGMFLPIVPAVYPNDQLPLLAEYPWHMIQEDRFQTEYAQLTGHGLHVSVVLWSANPEPPLEICLLTARVGAERLLILVTPHNYPKERPTARLAPSIAIGPEDDEYQIFEEAWARSEPVHDPPGWSWTGESYLIDYVRALEAALELTPAAPDKPTDRRDSEPVSVAQDDRDDDELGSS